MAVREKRLTKSDDKVAAAGHRSNSFRVQMLHNLWGGFRDIVART